MQHLLPVELRPTRRGPRLRLEHLYLLLALAACGVLVSLMPTPPNDIWWHLRIGQLIASEGQIPATNRFAWSLPADAPFVYGAWLGEYLLYQLYALGGWALVVFARNLQWLLTLGLLAWATQMRTGAWRWGAFTAALVTAMSLNNLIVRPQNWSWLPFAVMVVVLTRWSLGRGRRWELLGLPLVMAFWVNAHGAWLLGLVLPAVWTAGETLRTLFRQADAAPRRRLAELYVAGLATLAATLLNPSGWGIYGYVAKLLTDAPSQRLVEEWQSPTPQGIANITFFVTVLLLLAVFALAQRRPTLTDVVVSCAFLWLAWSGMRYVVWWGMLAAPILAQSLTRPTAAPPRRPHRESGLFNGVLAVMLLIPVVLAQPWFVRAVPLGVEYQRTVLAAPAPPLLTVTTPVAAVEWLRAHPGGRLWNDMGYGSYLIWAMPEQMVFVDTRVELFPLTQWQDYSIIRAGYALPALFTKYGIDRVLLDRAGQPQLSTALATLPGWRREYQDTWSEVWREE